MSTIQLLTSIVDFLVSVIQFALLIPIIAVAWRRNLRRAVSKYLRNKWDTLVGRYSKAVRSSNSRKGEIVIKSGEVSEE